MAGIFRGSPDPRSTILAQIGQNLGAGVGQAVKQKGLTSAVEGLTREGLTPEGIFQRIAAFDPEFAKKNLEATLSAQSKEQEKAFAQSLAFNLVEEDKIDMETAKKVNSIKELGTILGFLKMQQGGVEKPLPSVPINMSGAQLQAQFPGDSKVQGLPKGEVFPVRIQSDGTLLEVGTRPPVKAPDTERNFDRDVQSTTKLNLSIDPIARITDPNTQQRALAIQKRAQDIGGNSGIDAANAATTEMLGTPDEIATLKASGATETQVRDALKQIWGTDKLFDDVIEAIYNPTPESQGIIQRFFGSFGGGAP